MDESMSWDDELTECPDCDADLRAYQEELGKVWCPDCKEYKR